MLSLSERLSHPKSSYTLILLEPYIYISYYLQFSAASTYFGADFLSSFQNFHLPCTQQCKQQKTALENSNTSIYVDIHHNLGWGMYINWINWDLQIHEILIQYGLSEQFSKFSFALYTTVQTAKDALEKFQHINVRRFSS